MPLKKELGAAILIAILAFAAHEYTTSAMTGKIADSYTTIENQETLRDDVAVSDDELKKIYECQKPKQSENKGVEIEECMRSFYDAYTMQNGIDKGFAHLARLEKEHPELLPSCHYISHGIGHAALRLNDNDPYVAFDTLDSGNFFKNVVTCGNGYYHGIIEEIAKDEVDKDGLVRILAPICANEKIKNKGNCVHGVGHAAMIQTGYSVPDMLYICDRLSAKADEIFGCHTGGFMEYAQLNPDSVHVEDGILKFDLCDAQEKKYQAACYLEQSSFFEGFSEEPRNYSRNIGFCKQIDDDLNRMACIKLFAIRAVRLAHYKDVYEMCRNTSTPHERIMCTAVIADKIGGSVDRTRKTKEYAGIIGDVCGTMNFLYRQRCLNIIYKAGKRLFYTSEADLKFSTSTTSSMKTALLELLYLL